MIDANDPLVREKAMTPKIIVTTQKSLSGVFNPFMSPYPTVVMVVHMK